MAERDRIGKAIKLINPDALFSYNGEDIDSITWHGGTTPISKTDIEAKLALVDVLEKRKTEYLSWNEQLDKLWHDINDGKLDKTDGKPTLNQLKTQIVNNVTRSRHNI